MRNISIYTDESLKHALDRTEEALAADKANREWLMGRVRDLKTEIAKRGSTLHAIRILPIAKYPL